jgi:hypothetical protein
MYQWLATPSGFQGASRGVYRRCLPVSYLAGRRRDGEAARIAQGGRSDKNEEGT